MEMRNLFPAAAVAGLLLVSCQNMPQQQQESKPVSAESNTTSGTQDQAQTGRVSGVAMPVGTGKSNASARQEIHEIGTGRFIRKSSSEDATEELASSEEGDITLNFQGTDLREFIKAILGDVLNKNYFIDEKVSGNVTIDTAEPIDRNELLPLLENILDMNNAALINKNGVFQILPKDQAIPGNLSPSTVQRADKPGYGVRIIPLRYVAAGEMQKILEPFVAKDSDLRIDKKRNLVIISGTREQLDTIQETVDVFDVDWLRGMSIGLYPLDYVDPETLQKELDSIINAIEAGEGKEMLGGLVRTVPIERLNSILLIGSTQAALREVEIWLYRLDKPGNHSGKRLYVYNVQNAKATDLADILGHIFKAGGMGDSSQPPPAELAPGLRKTEISSKTGPGNRSDQPSGHTDESKNTTASSIAISGDNSVEIIADDVHNAVVVLATPQEYKMVEATVKKLDIVPLQVLIEASILEVTLNDNLNYGVEWFFKNSFDKGNARGGEATLDLGESGLSAIAPGFSYIINTADEVRGALNALAQQSELNVLSSPSLMVLDNQTATINVGDEIPVPTRQSVSLVNTDAPAVNEIQFRQTGVTLTVTPRVNSGGLVTMDIKQEVSSAVSTTTSDLDAPTIQQRQIESVVAINSGETIVLGGLIQDTQSNSDGGVPVLHRIPLIGGLFGSTRDEKRRTELLVLITPRVIGSKNEAREVTDEFRKKLKGLKPPPGSPKSKGSS